VQGAGLAAGGRGAGDVVALVIRGPSTPPEERDHDRELVPAGPPVI